MRQKRIMLDRSYKQDTYTLVMLTLDAHSVGSVERIKSRFGKIYPELEIIVHAAASWEEDPSSLLKAKEDLARANMVLITLVFLEDHISAILPDLKKARENCDLMLGLVSSKEIVNLTKMGGLDMSKPSSGVLKFLKKLRGDKNKVTGGEKQMAILRQIPKVLKFIPGKAQDLRAYFLSMQYWLAGSEENIESLFCYLLSKYSTLHQSTKIEIKSPVEYPETGLYHPDLPKKITEKMDEIPVVKHAIGSVGILLMRSYVLSGDTGHYDQVIRSLEAQGLNVIPAFAAGLDARPAINKYFINNSKASIDAFLSLTGFSLVGGPAYNSSKAAEEALAELDVPYIAAHAIEFQNLNQWDKNDGGLNPIETTILVSLPELDGATNPTIFGGRLGEEGGCSCCVQLRTGQEKAFDMVPCYERIKSLSEKTRRLVKLKRKENSEKKVGIILYGFPPNAGSIGTAAYLSVFESLYNVLKSMRNEGYKIELPKSTNELREIVLGGNSGKYGQEANVIERIDGSEIVENEPYLKEIEEVWGSAPGKIQSDGTGVFVLGKKLGNVVVGIQPTFGYEGDPMRLLFEKGFAPTHAFSTFYRWMRNSFKVDAFLHFGMHGALEFMPGKKVGSSSKCWPDRLIGNIPNIYVYAANNPSEASLAKRRTNAVIISHLTPPLAKAGLYKGLIELKETVIQYRELADDDSNKKKLEDLIIDQAKLVNFKDFDTIENLWLKILESEDALIPDGLHIIGADLSEEKLKEYDGYLRESHNHQEVNQLLEKLKKQTEVKGITDALNGQFIRPVPGGDLIRSPDIVPTGRNIHAFDPFRMPSLFAMKEGEQQAELLLSKHETYPNSVAMVLWGSDNIKSDGLSIAQAMALMGAMPKFDDYGRLCGAELISLSDLGRPRIDVLMTLSGIFRDLLPLQVRMLASAAYKASLAEEPLDMNFIRANTLKHQKDMNIDIKSAALRVFSNAEGAYGSNVSHLIDTSSWDDEEELADTFNNRKGFAYGLDGKCTKQSELLSSALKKVDFAYQNLESVELGVTTIDHYFDTLGGISRAVKKANGGDTIPVYIGDQTRGDAAVRTLSEQINLETRTRSLNPKWFEPLLQHGHEGVRQIEAQITNTLGWSATTGQVDPDLYDQLSETFVLDEEMRRKLSELNPKASLRVANRLLEAHERDYWQPDQDTLDALRKGADELEDKVEGVGLAAE